jgi:hypothetical protein
MYALFKEYAYLFFLLVSLLTIAIVKIIHPFWNLQPVYHTYDIWRWWYWWSFVFYRNSPVKTKFYDPFHIKTLDLADISDEEFKEWVDFLQIYFLSTDRIFGVFQKAYLEAHVAGNLEPSYVSFYKDVPLVLNEATPTPNIKGCIFSRPANISMGSDISFSAYYWDFLCSHREAPPKILHQLIQTNEYNQRLKNPDIKVSLFKKEVVLVKGVIPITQFKTRTYYLQMAKPPKLPPEYECVRVFKENRQLLCDSLKENIRTFDMSVLPDYGNLLALIDAKVLFVFLLKHRGEVRGIYLFKDLYLHYEDLDQNTLNVDDLGNSIHCVASIQQVDSPLFYLGFLYSLSLILRYNPKYRILLIEEVGDNVVLLRGWNRRPIFETDTAYYFFNYFSPRILSSERCFILL